MRLLPQSWAPLTESASPNSELMRNSEEGPLSRAARQHFGKIANFNEPFTEITRHQDP